MPPSSVVRFEPRSGSLREPLMVVPRMVGPPLSLKKKISVFSSSPRGPELFEHRADGLVHRRRASRRTSCALRVGDRRESLQPAVGGVHRRVHGVEGQVEEERLGLVPLDERDRLAAEGVGQVFLLLDDLRAAIDGCSPGPAKYGCAPPRKPKNSSKPRCCG